MTPNTSTGLARFRDRRRHLRRRSSFPTSSAAQRCAEELAIIADRRRNDVTEHPAAWQ